jgi:non-lysosomal glucosylceramidase
MNGFEHQLAGHMIWEGMVTEGLAIERAVHDRYHASRRNPWNEIECGDHYARSMASFGVFLAACGFEYNGPAGVLGFAPKMSPENFRAPFVTAQGWGTFSQSHDGRKMTTEIAIKYGKLKLSSLVLAQPEKIQPNIVSAMLAEKPVEANLKVIDGKIRIGIDATVEKDQTLHFILT